MQAIDQTPATRRADRQSPRTLFALCPILITLAALIVGAALTSADTPTVVGGALPSATSKPAGLDNPMVPDNPEIVPRVDLDLDSDHTHDYDGWPTGGEPTGFEDEIEDGSGYKTNYSGLKFVVVNDFYEFENPAAIEGYADGFDLDGSTSTEDDVMAHNYGPTNKEVFVEMQLSLDGCTNYSRTHVTFKYPESDPWAVCTNSGVDGIEYRCVPTNGNLRIWTADQNTNRSGLFIHSGSNYIASALGFSLISKVKTFYVEAVAHSASLEDLRIEAEAYEVTDDGPTPTSVDAVRVTAIRCDVDVDSNNDDGNSLSRSGGEDRYEDIGGMDYPGKLLAVNDDDDDGDGIVDYFDGFDRTADAADNVTSNENFIPVIFEIPAPIDIDVAKVRIDYPGSDPADIRHGPVLPVDGSIRIWNLAGDAARSGTPIQSGGNYLEPGYEYAATDLGFSSAQRVVTNYIEAVKVSAEPGDIRIVMNVDPDGVDPGPSTPGYIAVDAVRCTIINVDIAETNEFKCSAMTSATLNLTAESYSPDGYAWTSPAGLSNSWSGSTFTYYPSNSIPGTYVVECASSNLTSCSDTCTVNIIKVDIDDAGVRDTDDLQIQHFENNNGTFTYTAIPYQIYYTIEPDTGWAPDNVLLKIRDASGAVIRTKLLSVGTGIGQQQATWDGQDHSGAYPEYGSNTYTAEIVVNKGATVCSDKKIFSIYEIRQGNNLYRDNGWPVPDIHGAILYEYNGFFNSLADLQDDSKYTVVHHRGAFGTMATDSVAVFKTGGSGTYMGAHCPDELKNADRRAKRKAILEKAAQMLAANPPYIFPVTDVLHHKGLTWDGTIADIAETRSDGVNEVSYEGVSVRLYGSSWWNITTRSPSTNLDKHNDGSDSMMPSKQRSGPLTTNTPDELRKP